MTRIALRLGPLAHPVLRSGLRWLCEDGHLCRANEIVAYCNIALRDDGSEAFGEERFDLQVAFTPRIAGRIRRAPAASRGGYVDRLPSSVWAAERIWAYLEDPMGESEGPVEEPNLQFLAGRRFTGIAEDRSGLLTGWHDRTRSWWGEGEGATLLAAGTCEQDGIFRGDGGAFGEMYGRIAGPAQLVVTQDEPLVPCAAFLLDQLRRTPEDLAAIREDIAATFPAGSQRPAAEEWLFMGALLNALERSPLEEGYDILTRSGPRRSPPAAAVCLSLTAEMTQLPRHRRLGYAVNFHGFRLAAIGPAVKEWLQRNFEASPRTVDDVAGDYRRLFAAAPDRAFFVVNRISSQVYEHIQSYEGLDDATMAGFGTLRSQELNLMLHDLARESTVGIVDADAIAADVGIRAHLPDGVHGSGVLYGEIRAELLRQAHARGIPGFAPRAVSRS